MSRFLKRVLLALGVLTVSFGIVGAGYAYYLTAQQVKAQGGRPEEAAEFWLDPAKHAFGDKNRLNVLCMGVDYNYTRDGMPYSKEARSDTIMLISFERKHGTVAVLSIPRDLLVEIPGLGRDKINAAYAYGGAPLARKTVAALLGVKIDYVVSVRVQAARKLVDELGGLTLDVEKDMDYDDNWGHLHVHLRQGRQKLDGEQVVGYCRFRYDEEGDFGRIRRQQQVITALTRTLKAEASLETINKLAKIFRQNVTTDLPLTKMLALGRLYRGMDRKQLKLGRLECYDSIIDGIYYLEPSTEQNKLLVRRLLNTADDLPLSAFRVEILNASGQPGAARNAEGKLCSLGFTVVDSRDIPGTCAATKVVDRMGSPRACARLQEVVPARILSAIPRPDDVADLTVTLGKDYRF